MSYQNLHVRELGDDQKYFEEHIVAATAGMVLIVGILGLAVYGLIDLVR